MPILGSSSSASDKDMMAKIWTNGDERLSTRVEKGEIACYEQFLLIPQCFKKQSGVDGVEMSIYGVKG